MRYVGAHVSVSGGIATAPGRAHLIGANAFACFVKNERRWFSNPFSLSEITEFKKQRQINAIFPEHVIAHSSYLINLANPNREKRQLSINSLIAELKLCAQIGVRFLVLHPGSHLRLISETEGLELIAAALNELFKATEFTTILLENSAGQGSNLGYKLEQLAAIIAGVEDKARVGICLDSCHFFASGYDFSTQMKYHKCMDELNHLIGLEYLHAIHFNDSKTALGSRVDRHASLGEGNIGKEALAYFLRDQRLDEIPFILETPNPNLWAEEIKWMRSVASQN